MSSLLALIVTSTTGESKVMETEECEKNPSVDKQIVVNDVSVVNDVANRDVSVVNDGDDDLLRDPCRELMMSGECGEQYHSDDDSFIIGGDGDQKTLD